MAGRIPDADIAAVRDRTSIIDVVGEYVALRRAGGDSMKGLCPFHEERTASFNVSSSRGTYHCFGCGVGGDVIDFIRRIEQLDFVEAVERLAAKGGIQIRYEGGGQVVRRTAGERTRSQEANAAAAAYYVEQLGTPAAAGAREFLQQRGFDRGAAETFGCGFAPEGWENVVKVLRHKGFSDKEILTAGLASETRRQTIVDRFRGRLIWPIRSVAGDVVGFGARRLREDDDGPKYLNTPETPLYKKSQVLYGLDLAKREIAQQHRVVVVEGYTDVMACHLAGVPIAVATCGTAFGPEHVGVLRRLLMDSGEFAGEVIFTFDGDSAGQQAALRAFGEDQRFVAQTYVAVEKSGLDPCDLRLQHGDTAVRDLIARREPLIAFALRSELRKYNLETVEGRVLALRAAAPLVARIKDRSMLPGYTRKLAGDLGLELGEVQDEVRRAGASRDRRPPQRDPAGLPAHAAPPGKPAGPERPAPKDPRFEIDREALKIAVQQPGLAGPLFDEIGPEAFAHPAYAAVRETIASCGGVSGAAGGGGWVEMLREKAPPDAVRGLVSELAVESLRTHGDLDARYVGEILAALRLRPITRQIAELKGRLQRTNPLEAEDEHRRLFGELIALEKYKIALRDQALGNSIGGNSIGDADGLGAAPGR